MTAPRRTAIRLALLLFALLLALSAAGCAKKQPPLTITAVLPADGSTGVPIANAVEITFSAPPEKLDDYFAIDPPVEGRFQYMDEVVAFLPGLYEGKGGLWEPETTYTVTVKAGLKTKDGKSSLAEDCTFSFTGGDGSGSGYRMRTLHETFLPQDLPVLDIGQQWYSAYVWHISAQEEFQVAVHRIEDGPRYLRELYRAEAVYNEVRVDTAALPEVLTFTQTMAEARTSEDDDRQADIVFPEPLPAGWYVATVTTTRDVPPVQKLLQIQESAVYTQVANSEALLWFNSTADGKPVAGAQLSVIRDPFASMEPAFGAAADADGILRLDLSTVDANEDDTWPRNGAPLFPYALTAPSGTVYYDVLSSWHYGYERTYPQDYYAFLYTDRTLYHQTDTVKFWGVVKPRKDAPALPAVKVMLTPGYDIGEAVAETEVPVSPDGIFTGEISYQDLRSGGMILRVLPAREDDTKERYSWDSIVTEYLEIARFKKPLYTASISTDKLYYRPGEAIDTEVTVSLFDRTPADGVRMRLFAGDYDEGEVLTTGADGVIRARKQAPDTSNTDSYAWGWYPVAYSLRAQNEDASDVPLSVNETVYAFPTTIMLDAVEEAHGSTSDLVITANRIDFSKIPGGRQVIQDYDTLRGAAASIPVTVQLHKVTNTRVELPPVYDRYTKKSVPRVTYRRSDEIADTFRQSTGADGVLRLRDILPPESEDVHYYVEIIVHEGGYQTTTRCLGRAFDFYPQEGTATSTPSPSAPPSPTRRGPARALCTTTASGSALGRKPAGRCWTGAPRSPGAPS